jgi:hypothetical protein
VLGCIAAENATKNYSGNFWWEPEWNHLHDRALALCRDALSEAAFKAAWVEWQALSLEQAVERALTVFRPSEARLPPD